MTKDSNRDSSGNGNGRDRTIGKGMSSPDSTQVPLDAQTGEPDPRTQRDRKDEPADRSGDPDR